MLGLKLNHVSKRGHRPHWGNETYAMVRLLCVVKSTRVDSSTAVSIYVNQIVTWRPSRVYYSNASGQHIDSLYASFPNDDNLLCHHNDTLLHLCFHKYFNVHSRNVYTVLSGFFCFLLLDYGWCYQNPLQLLHWQWNKRFPQRPVKYA